MRELDVWNLALGRLGRAAVSGLDDAEVGGVLGLVWQVAVDCVVSDVVPGWAVVESRLEGREAGDAGVVGGFRFKGLLAAEDVVRVVDASPGRWARKGDYVLWVEEGCLFVRWLRRPDASDVFEPVFAEVLACKLAQLACMRVTGDRGMEASLLEEYRRVLVPGAQYGARLQDMGRESDLGGRVLM